MIPGGRVVKKREELGKRLAAFREEREERDDDVDEHQNREHAGPAGGESFARLRSLGGLGVRRHVFQRKAPMHGPPPGPACDTTYVASGSRLPTVNWFRIRDPRGDAVHTSCGKGVGRSRRHRGCAAAATGDLFPDRFGDPHQVVAHDAAHLGVGVTEARKPLRDRRQRLRRQVLRAGPVTPCRRPHRGVRASRSPAARRFGT